MTAFALAEYQDAFARALLAEDPLADAPPALARLVAQPGFSVYRNTVLKGYIDALQANFPAVVRLVGEEWFRAAAAIYARNFLPAHPSLLIYGADFTAFLASFGPAAEMPYLPEVARVDRLWTEAHVAADEEVLDASSLARLAEDDMTRLNLRPHATTRWAWCDDSPMYTLWSRNRNGGADHAAPFEWIGEGVLLTRPYGAVLVHPIGREGIAFLSACAAGRCIASAAGAAQRANADADLSALIQLALQAGAFGALQAVND